MTSTAPTPDPRPWRLALPAFALLVTWVLFLYRDTAEAMVTIWLRSETFTHCLVVPPIVAWLVWRQRRAIGAETPAIALWGIVLLAAAGFGWLLGDLVAINAATQFALVAMLVLLVPAMLGTRVTLLIVFPLAFLFFAVPFGEFVMPQFMVWTADFTVLALRLSGIPVYREGLQFVIPSGNWSVVEACSGVRYLIASLTVGTLFAYLNYRSSKRRAVFIAVSILVPVVANWARAYMIVMLGHLSGNKIATGVDHLLYGWVFFGVVIMIMFMIGARWAEPDADPAALGAQPASHATGAVSGAGRAGFALLVAVLVALPVVGRLAIERSGVAGAPSLVAPDTLSEGWRIAPERVADWKPAFDNPSVQSEATYRQGPMAVGIYLGYYRSQAYDRKLVSSQNVLVRSGDPLWAEVASSARATDLGGKTLTLRTAELRGSQAPGQSREERLVVWRMYWINGTWTASDLMAKLYGAWYRLLGRGDDSAVVMVYAPKGAAGQGELALEAFLRANAAVLDGLLQQTRARR